MTRIFERLGLLSAVAPALLMFSGIAYCGDEDKDPAYMIYIDPETGKYTTEDPDARTTADAVAMAVQPSDKQRSNLPLMIGGASVLVVLLVVGLVKHQRRQII